MGAPPTGAASSQPRADRAQMGRTTHARTVATCQDPMLVPAPRTEGAGHAQGSFHKHVLAAGGA